MGEQKMVTVSSQALGTEVFLVTVAAVNTAVEGHLVQQRLIITYNGDRVFIWIDRVYEPTNNGLHLVQAVDLFFIWQIAGFYNKHIHRITSPELSCP